jgi:hypothetical protein
MKCKLCHLDKQLCQSHIVPESAYGSLYDNKHRFYEVSNVQKIPPILQKGLREPLLCEECEQHLNKYDSYFADLWYQNDAVPSDADRELISIHNIDYHRFKLFHMSVLWRAGVASREEFAAVNLGVHEQELRKLILADNPGDPKQYAVFGYFLASPDGCQVYQALLAQPVAVDLNDLPGFHFVFGGCAWHYILASSIDTEQYPFILQEDGSLHLMRVYIDQYDPVMDLMKERINQGWKSGG